MAAQRGPGMDHQGRADLRTLAVAAALAVLLSACAALKPAVQPPHLNLIDVRFLDAQLFEQRYQLTFRVLNPNDMDIPIQGMYFELALADRPFGTGVSNIPVTLPAYGEATVTVTVSTNIINTVKQLAEFFQGRPQVVAYRLSGHLKVDLPIVGRLPVSAEGTVRLAPDGAAPKTP